MAEAKHSFVDDNPYLMYSPIAEMTYDGNSGGGGDDAPIFKITEKKASFEDNSGSGSGFPIIEYSGTALQIKASDLLAMVDVSPVLFKYDDGDSTETWGFIIKGFITDNAYYFNSLVGNQVVRFVAISADGKPKKI